MAHKQMTQATPELAPWSPFRDFHGMRNMVSRLLEDVLSGNGRELRLALPEERQWLPAVDVEETEKEYMFSFELPGMDKGDFKVEVQDSTLAISGEKKSDKEEKRKNYLRHEQYYGSFRRMFSLPSDAQSSGIKAAYKNGVLKVAIPRSKTAKPKSVQVRVD